MNKRILLLVSGIGYLLMLWFSVVVRPEAWFLSFCIITFIWVVAILATPLVDDLIKFLEDKKDE